MPRTRSKLRTLNLISVIFFMVVMVIYIAQEKKSFLGARQDGDAIQVVVVHDGDTVSVTINGKQEKVRLIGIDAPEIGQKPWGQESKRHLESILKNTSQKVRMEFDVEKTDQHGRILAYLWTADKSLINLMMVKNGYAMLYTVPPNVKYAEEFRKAQAEARERGRGIWGEDGLNQMPRDYRRENPRTQ